MKKIFPALLLVWSASAWAADAAPLFFRAVLVMGTKQYFSLSTEGGARQQWVAKGDTFEGYEVVRYEDASKTLVVAKDGSEFSLQLAIAPIKEAPVKATLAQAEEVLRKIDFERMMGRIIEQQKQSVVAMVRKMDARNGAPGVSPEELAAFQARVIDAMWSEMRPQDLTQEVARIYSEVFTKDELDGLSDFYSTPAGRAMVAKQPEVQQKMMQVMMPRLMAAMPKVKEMAREFAAEHAAKARASQTATVTPAAAPGAPPTPAGD